MIRARNAAWMPAALLLAAALMFALVIKTQAGVLPAIPALTPFKAPIVQPAPAHQSATEQGVANRTGTTQMNAPSSINAAPNTANAQQGPAFNPCAREAAKSPGCPVMGGP